MWPRVPQLPLGDAPVAVVRVQVAGRPALLGVQGPLQPRHGRPQGVDLAPGSIPSLALAPREERGEARHLRAGLARPPVGLLQQP